MGPQVTAAQKLIIVTMMVILEFFDISRIGALVN